jgi:hypothetical protein
MSDMPEHRWVTNAELKSEIADLKAVSPTRWEVRFLIVAGIVASNVLPPLETAGAWVIGLVL